MLQAVSLALKGMEAKHAAERQLQEQRLVAERAKAAKASEAAEAAVSVLRARITQLRAALIEVSAQCFTHACASVGDKVPLLDREASCYGGHSTSGGSSAGSSGDGGRTAVPLLPLSSGKQAGQQQQSLWGAVPLSAGLRAQPVLAVGERWLYMHLPKGVWRRTRQLLLHPAQDAPEGLMRQSSSSEWHLGISCGVWSHIGLADTSSTAV